MRAMARSHDSVTNRTARTTAAGNRAKSHVMAAIGGLVDEGKAEWNHTATGDIELRLLSGEVFVLGEVSVTRVE
ncbi:hypothetical protein EN904_14175 [Mesorhizobium sp. M7A.F.Ca.CA.001.07.2.1]|nr:hypothetical protein EN983_18635 [Mesorhizobium sp. M7A.F.Ca.CA.004.08.2.1]RUX83992.1 hypothetical protein EN982_24950 [Mesorhizobium sp. M7A.F.Ca.CA.004.08.1.1]RUY02671.1 hypothetical protein EN985_18745 [Mesorhizobium sp. M7A.F.Ca.CA.004.04.1.1]RUY17574.1 hypothetical protein EN984_29305 [Mesorhizobium sp. M7A.F.Ca.CA.004.12.1.1]RUY52267.1 hypothetical protein EN973_24125 [Mesorhizobium sp. M7A.F.Ca.CA.001.12.1.1]RUY86041.1 hypothetical protein EN964_20685 [Mesorhizobium sp. M7A.F.Ca.CA.0